MLEQSTDQVKRELMINYVLLGIYVLLSVLLGVLIGIPQAFGQMLVPTAMAAFAIRRTQTQRSMIGILAFYSLISGMLFYVGLDHGFQSARAAISTSCQSGDWSDIPVDFDRASTISLCVCVADEMAAYAIQSAVIDHFFEGGPWRKYQMIDREVAAVKICLHRQ